MLPPRLAAAAPIDTVIVGAGIVGLAISRCVALRGYSVIVLEAESAIGTGISSRHSEVIHAGIPYATGSRKAALSIEGRKRLVRYAKERAIPHRICGKLIVANGADEIERLESLYRQGRVNGVEALRLLSKRDALRLEPALRADAALLSPVTGIIDSHRLMKHWAQDVASADGIIALRSPLVRADCAPEGFRLHIGGKAPCELRARRLINAAGLASQDVARAIEPMPYDLIPTRYLAKGSYFSVRGKCPFDRLIYPIPEDGGLGIHLTFDLEGHARLGPDIQWIDEINFRVNPERRKCFYETAVKYWPDLKLKALSPAYAGIRPKLGVQGSDFQDFLVQDETMHGVPGLMNLFGIESPGLTAAMALAEDVADRLNLRQ